MHKNMNACFSFMLISCAQAISSNQKLNGHICNVIDYKQIKKFILKKFCQSQLVKDAQT